MITQDKITEFTQESDAIVIDHGQDWSVDEGDIIFDADQLAKYTALVSAHAITSMQTEQPVDAILVSDMAESYSVEFGCMMLSADANCIQQVYTHPAPVTSMQGDSKPFMYFNAKSQSRDEMPKVSWEKDGYCTEPLFTHVRVKGVSDERAEFEKSYKELSFKYNVFNDQYFELIGLTGTSHIEYAHPPVQNAWLIWQARSQLSTNTDGWVKDAERYHCLMNMATRDYENSVKYQFVGRLSEFVDEIKPSVDSALSQDKGEAV